MGLRPETRRTWNVLLRFLGASASEQFPDESEFALSLDCGARGGVLVLELPAGLDLGHDVDSENEGAVGGRRRLLPKGPPKFRLCSRRPLGPRPSGRGARSGGRRSRSGSESPRPRVRRLWIVSPKWSTARSAMSPRASSGLSSRRSPSSKGLAKRRLRRAFSGKTGPRSRRAL